MKALKTNISPNGHEDLRIHEEVISEFHVSWNELLHSICSFQKFRRELKIWGRLQHKNIVPLLGVVSGFGPLPSTVSPWFRNGSLSRYMVDRQISKSMKQRLVS